MMSPLWTWRRFGQFDFIVCHGVYSWVPDERAGGDPVRLRTMLSPEGVAYISYNVYPGWKAKEIVRDAMLLRGGERATPEEKLSLCARDDRFPRGGGPGRQRIGKALADVQGISDQRQGVLRTSRGTWSRSTRRATSSISGDAPNPTG